jgi:hypothetical protein
MVHLIKHFIVDRTFLSKSPFLKLTFLMIFGFGAGRRHIAIENSLILMNIHNHKPVSHFVDIGVKEN